ncbi:uncharacterized protein [Coffea arabica]|uniref:Uncharacterized protein n=1 Tax=Coffea arabica TaxID=13443 RepID=A0ABM4VTR6_COFAR
MAEQTPEPTRAEQEAPEPASASGVVEEVAEPALASADVEVPVPTPTAAMAAVTVVEKEVSLSLAQPAVPLAEEKASVSSTMKEVSTSKPLAEALAEPQESGFPQPLPPPPGQAEVVIEAEISKTDEGKNGDPFSWIFFKEESNIVADLTDFQRKALEEFKSFVQKALNNKTFTTPFSQKAQEASS